MKEVVEQVAVKLQERMIENGHKPGKLMVFDPTAYAACYCQVCGLHGDITLVGSEVMINGPAFLPCSGFEEAYDSPKWTPFEKDESYSDPFDVHSEHSELYHNSRYHVVKSVSTSGEMTMVHLSIRDNNRTARHDWRDFQRIKNELVGPEEEAIEIYPAESRLVDGANQYHLWIALGHKIPGGFPSRQVSETSDLKGCVQRPWDSDDRPADAKHFTMEDVEKAKAKIKANGKG